METLCFHYKGSTTCRLDTLVVNAVTAEPDWEEQSRSQIKQWIGAGRVSLNGKEVRKAGTAVRPQDEILVVYPKPHFPKLGSSQLEEYDFPLDILYEDEAVIVVNKPAGLTVHPGAGNANKTMLNALLTRFPRRQEFMDQSRLGIVHRLDKDTSGVLVVAKTLGALQRLSEQFAKHTTKRVYHALVYVTPRAKRAVQLSDSGTIETLIGRSSRNRLLMEVVDSGGREAVTHWQVLERMYHATLLEVRLESGRTHQIRVHMKHIRSPVLGDPSYSGVVELPAELSRLCHSFGRQALHAKCLSFTHPYSKEQLTFNTPLPEDFSALIEAFRDERAEGG